MMRRLAIVGLAVLIAIGAGEVVPPVRGESVLLAQSEADWKREGDRLFQQGLDQLKISQFERALQSFEKARKIYKKIGDRQGKASSLANLGLVNLSLGEYYKGIEFTQKALKIQRKIRDRKGIASSSNNLGLAHKSLGNYNTSILFHIRSLKIQREIRDRQGEASSFNNLGLLYESLGEVQKAILHYKQSLAIKQEIKDRKGEANSLGNLSSAYGSQGKYKKVFFYGLQALEIQREIRDRQGEASSLSNLGLAYKYSGNYPKAISYFQQSIKIQRKLGNKQGLAASLENLGLVYRSKKRYKKAIKLHQQSLAIKRQTDNREEEAISLHNLGLAFLRFGDLKRSKFVLHKSIQVLESLRAGLPDKQRINIFEPQSRTYRLLQETLIKLNQYEEALEVSERGRTQSLIEQLRKKQNITSKLSTVANLKHIAKKQNSILVEYTVDFDDFQIEGKEQPKESKLYIWVIQPNGKITFRSTDLKHLWNRETTPNKTPNLAAIKFQDFWEQHIHPYNLILIYLLLSTLFVSGIASIYPFVYGDPKKRSYRRTIAFSTLTLISLTGLLFTLGQTRQIVASRSATNRSQPPQTPLGQLVYQSQNPTTAQTRGRFDIFDKFGQRHEDALKQLHQILIDPIADLLPTDPEASVIFIPDRDLFFVPFPALTDASGQYLIDRHTISTSPSIQLLSTTRKPKPSTFKGENALIIGNPIMPKYYDISLDRVASLDPLPHTQREAETIAKLLQSRPILGADASETAITRQMPRAKLLHFATHGLLDGFRGSVLNNNLGAIALTSDPNYDPLDPTNTLNDGLLTAQEIYNMQLTADLAVLSACQTGLGRVTSDGIVGLSRAFINAGVPTVVMSLWNVPDAPTADLMTEFYQNLQNTPNKAQALRQAMLTIRATHPEPKNWAGFTVMGQR